MDGLFANPRLHSIAPHYTERAFVQIFSSSAHSTKKGTELVENCFRTVKPGPAWTVVMAPSVLPAAGAKQSAQARVTDNGVNDVNEKLGGRSEEHEDLENGHIMDDDEDREEDEEEEQDGMDEEDEEEADEGEEGEAEDGEDQVEGEGVQATAMDEELEPGRAAANGAVTLTGAAIDYGGDYSLDEGNLLVCDTRPLDGARLFDQT